MGERNPATPSQQPDQPERSVAEQVPHSGVHHGERPVDTFDNTPLKDAVEQRLVNELPETPAELVDHATESKRRRPLVWISVGTAAVVVTAGAIVGVNLANEHAGGNAYPEKDPKGTGQTPEASSTPTESYQAAPTAEQLASYNIPANATPEQMALAYTKMQSDIRGALLKPATYHEWAVLTGDNGMTAQGAAQKIAEAWVKPFFDAQYEENYMSVTNLQAQYNSTANAVAINVNNYTGEGSVQDALTVDNNVTVLHLDTHERQLQISQTEHYSDEQSPSDQNIAEANGRQSVQDVTFILSRDGSRWLVSGWQGGQ